MITRASLQAYVYIHAECTCTNMLESNGLRMHNCQFNYSKLKVYREWCLTNIIHMDGLLSIVYAQTLPRHTTCQHVNMYSFIDFSCSNVYIHAECTCTNMFVRNGLCMHNWQFSYSKLKVYGEGFKMVLTNL